MIFPLSLLLYFSDTKKLVEKLFKYLLPLITFSYLFSVNDFWTLKKLSPVLKSLIKKNVIKEENKITYGYFDLKLKDNIIRIKQIDKNLGEIMSKLVVTLE